MRVLRDEPGGVSYANVKNQAVGPRKVDASCSLRQVAANENDARPQAMLAQPPVSLCQYLHDPSWPVCDDKVCNSLCTEGEAGHETLKR